MSIELPKITAEEFYNSGFTVKYKTFEEYEAARLAQNSIMTVAKENAERPQENTTNPINARAQAEREELQAQYDELKDILRQNENDYYQALWDFESSQTDADYDKYIKARDLKSDNTSLAALLLDFIGMRNDTIRRTQA